MSAESHNEKNDKKVKKTLKKKRRSSFADLLRLTVFSLLLIYCLGVIISTQADIAEQKSAIEKLQAEITEARQENDEYERLLSSKDEYDYMLSAAIERGYAYPREVRFYAKNNVE